MPVLYYVQNAFVGFIILAILLFYVSGQGGRRHTQDSLFFALLLTALAFIALELAMDLLSGKVFYGSRTLLAWSLFLFFALNPLPGILYLLYLDQIRRRWVSVPRGIGLIAFIPLLLASLFNGIIFSIDQHNVYQRGALFPLMMGVGFLCLPLGFFYLFAYKDTFKGKNLVLLLVFLLPVLLGAILQFNFPGMEAVGVGFAISLLIAYLHMQNSQANKDYLTSLYNRSLGEQYLNHLIGHQKENSTIGGILMDIDDFKQINDTYGHDSGDQSLRHFSRLLVDSFGSRWFIARYGGDEFLLLRERATQQDIEDDKAYFIRQIAQFNARGTLPFPLSASVGTGLHAADQPKGGPAFIKLLDGRMYEDKRAFHSQSKRGG